MGDLEEGNIQEGNSVEPGTSGYQDIKVDFKGTEPSTRSRPPLPRPNQPHKAKHGTDEEEVRARMNTIYYVFLICVKYFE